MSALREAIRRASVLAAILLSGCVPLSNAEVLCEVARGVETQPGPACACNSFFPMCAGARWEYAVTDVSTLAAEPTKVWSLSGLAADIDLSLGYGKNERSKHLRYGWDYCRSSSEEVRQAWLTADDEAVYWEWSTWLAPDLTARKETLFDPRRVRLFTDLSTSAWADVYIEREIELSDGIRTTTDSDCRISWTVVAPPGEVLADPRFANRAILCEHSDTSCVAEGSDATDEDAAKTESATFCFVAGIGKVYEYTEGDVEETLTDWDVPGCD